MRINKVNSLSIISQAQPKASLIYSPEILTATEEHLENNQSRQGERLSNTKQGEVIMTQKQYNDKILEHLDVDCYTPLNKDPTDSLNRKLDSVLKKLLKKNKINKPFFDSCRTSNPRRPQLYGLAQTRKSH